MRSMILNQGVQEIFEESPNQITNPMTGQQISNKGDTEALHVTHYTKLRR